MTRTQIAAIATAALAVPLAILTAAVVTDTPQAAAVETTTAPTSIFMPQPEPPWGARVVMGGVEGTNCAQVAAVSVKSATKGVLFRAGGTGERWVTKVQRISGDTDTIAPPIFKGKMSPGSWILINRFSAQRVVFRVWYASTNCPGTTNAFKWNASAITVTVAP